MAVAFKVAMAASCTAGQLSLRCNAETNSAPKVPIPAASTGVARADVRAGKITTVVVYKVDRLTRSLADFAKLVELFD